jgi:hypothetical protein
MGSCREWTRFCGPGDYGRIKVAGRNEQVHRVAWALELGPLIEGEQVLHRCDNPPCFELSHLFVGDDAANMDDKVQKGRARGARSGSAHHGAKLTEAQVVAIRRRRGRGEKLLPIARDFDVSYQLVSQIARGEVWDAESSRPTS